MPQRLRTKQELRLFPAISLDLALSFYGYMQIPVEEPTVFQGILRATMNEIWGAVTIFEARPPLLGPLVARLDRFVVGPFIEWTEEAYLNDHEDQPELSGWSQVFTRFAYGQRARLDFLPKEKQSYYIEGYRKRVDTEDLEPQEAQVLRQPLSDWDLEMYIRQEYGISWESGPFSVIEPLIKMERLRRFGTEFWEILSAAEREEFWRRAQSYLDEERIWMPGPLPRFEDILRN